jgi:hypothetical protein
VLLLTFAVLAMGCSSIPRAAAMQTHDLSFATKQPGSLMVRVSGGQEFDFRIADVEFEQAIRDSLVESGLFASIVDTGAEYRLDVVLGDGMGIEGRELTVLWSLSRTDTRETFWQELVTSRGRSHHFVGVTRQRRGLEFAARENIRMGIERLAGADWTRPPREPAEPAMEPVAP